MQGSRGMGTILGPNTIRVYKGRTFIGTIDVDQRLYQWAPGKQGGSIQNFLWMGRMSFGEEEWATLLEYKVKRLEFKDPANMRIYRCKMKKAKGEVVREETRLGMRFLVPISCFKVEEVS